jgi:hypothetical protein
MIWSVFSARLETVGSTEMLQLGEERGFEGLSQVLKSANKTVWDGAYIVAVYVTIVSGSIDWGFTAKYQTP